MNFVHVKEEDIPEHWQLDILPGVTTTDMVGLLRGFTCKRPITIIVSVGLMDVRFANPNFSEDTQALTTLLQEMGGFAIGQCVNCSLDRPSKTTLQEIDSLLKVFLPDHYIDPPQHIFIAPKPYDIFYPHPICLPIWNKVLRTMGVKRPFTHASKN